MVSKKTVSVIALVVVAVCTVGATVLGAVFKRPVPRAADAMFGISDFFVDAIRTKAQDVDAGYSQIFLMRYSPSPPEYVLNFYAQPGQRVRVTLTATPARNRMDSLP